MNISSFYTMCFVHMCVPAIACICQFFLSTLFFLYFHLCAHNLVSNFSQLRHLLRNMRYKEFFATKTEQKYINLYEWNEVKWNKMRSIELHGFRTVWMYISLSLFIACNLKYLVNSKEFTWTDVNEWMYIILSCF